VEAAVNRKAKKKVKKNKLKSQVRVLFIIIWLF
jgi:hypothetical protein